MPLSGYGRKALLDWMLGGAAAPADPGAHWLGLSYGSPTSVSASEIAVPSSYARATVSAAEAGTDGIASAAANVIYAACSYSLTVSGWQLWDAQTGGSMLAFGLLSAATRPASGSQFTANTASFLMTADP